jgi:hypothetical protein
MRCTRRRTQYKWLEDMAEKWPGDLMVAIAVAQTMMNDERAWVKRGKLGRSAVPTH